VLEARAERPVVVLAYQLLLDAHRRESGADHEHSDRHVAGVVHSFGQHAALDAAQQDAVLGLAPQLRQQRVGRYARQLKQQLPVAAGQLRHDLVAVGEAREEGQVVSAPQPHGLGQDVGDVRRVVRAPLVRGVDRRGRDDAPVLPRKGGGQLERHAARAVRAERAGRELEWRERRAHADGRVEPLEPLAQKRGRVETQRAHAVGRPQRGEELRVERGAAAEVLGRGQQREERVESRLVAPARRQDRQRAERGFERVAGEQFVETRARTVEEAGVRGLDVRRRSVALFREAREGGVQVGPELVEQLRNLDREPATVLAARRGRALQPGAVDRRGPVLHGALRQVVGLVDDQQVLVPRLVEEAPQVHARVEHVVQVGDDHRGLLGQRERHLEGTELRGQRMLGDHLAFDHTAREQLLDQAALLEPGSEALLVAAARPPAVTSVERTRARPRADLDGRPSAARRQHAPQRLECQRLLRVLRRHEEQLSPLGQRAAEQREQRRRRLARPRRRRAHHQQPTAHRVVEVLDEHTLALARLRKRKRDLLRKLCRIFGLDGHDSDAPHLTDKSRPRRGPVCGPVCGPAGRSAGRIARIR